MTDATTPEPQRVTVELHEHSGEYGAGCMGCGKRLIEAQSRPTVASEGLRALLETLVDLWYMDDASDEHMYAIGVAFVAAKAALAAPAPPAGLTIAEIQAILDEAQA